MLRVLRAAPQFLRRHVELAGRIFQELPQVGVGIVGEDRGLDLEFESVRWSRGEDPVDELLARAFRHAEQRVTDYFSVDGLKGRARAHDGWVRAECPHRGQMRRASLVDGLATRVIGVSTGGAL